MYPFLIHVFGPDLIEVRVLEKDPFLPSSFHFNNKHSEMVCSLFLQYVQVGGDKGLKSLNIACSGIIVFVICCFSRMILHQAIGVFSKATKGLA